MLRNLLCLIGGIVTAVSKIVIALPNENITYIESYVDKSSNPLDSLYGHHLTMDEINGITKAPQYKFDKIHDWLKAENITTCYNYPNHILCNEPLSKFYKLCRLKSLFMPCNIPVELIDSISLIDGINPHFKPKHYGHGRTTMSSGFITSEVLDRIYSIPNLGNFNPKNLISVGVAEFQDNNGFLQTDLAQVQIQNNIANHTVLPSHIIGDNAQPSDLESMLDISMVAQVGGNVTDIWYWNNQDWLFSFAANIMISNSTPDVISISWGWSSEDQCSIIPCTNITSQQYVNRTNEEFLKIAARGITLVSSSGDSGSCGRANGDCSLDPKNNLYPLNPVFPTSSPFVLSVGGTYLVDGVSDYTPVCHDIVKCSDATLEAPSMSPINGWTTGGGFSKLFKMPQWQRNHVNTYLNTGIELPNETYFNKQNRAYPDITAVSNQCGLVIDGSWLTAAGTSCSAPIWGGIVGLMNYVRTKNNKPRVGLVAPLLYHIANIRPQCFNGIIRGNTTSTEYNHDCDKDYGFQSNTNMSWSPVSGLGSPNVSCILDYLVGGTG